MEFYTKVDFNIENLDLDSIDYLLSIDLVIFI